MNTFRLATACVVIVSTGTACKKSAPTAPPTVWTAEALGTKFTEAEAALDAVDELGGGPTTVIARGADDIEIYALDGDSARWSTVHAGLTPHFTDAMMECLLELHGYRRVGDRVGRIGAEQTDFPPSIVDETTFAVAEQSADRVIVRASDLAHDHEGDHLTGRFLLERQADGRWLIAGSDFGELDEGCGMPARPLEPLRPAS